MTFDEQLRRAFETVTGRLRDDIARHAETAIEELAEAAEADRAHAVADARDVAQREADARVTAANELDGGAVFTLRLPAARL